jgi:hypothetical protein
MHANASFRGRRIFFLAAYGLTALATHASGLWQPMHADYSCFLRVAHDWRDGAALYRASYDNKTPWLYRGVLAIDSGRPEVSCYLAETALAALVATLFRAALAYSLPRIASIVPLLLIVWSGTSQTFYGAQTTEAFAMWFAVASISSLALAARSGSLGFAATAGGGLFCAAVLRPPAILLVIAWLPFLILMYRRQQRGLASRLGAAAVGGFAVLAGIFYCDLAAHDLWGEFVAVLAHNRAYAALDRAAWPASLLQGGITLTRILLENPVVLMFLILSAVMWPWRRAGAGRVCWFYAAGLWLFAAVASAFPGGRHYAHYYHLVWPPLSLLAALWLGSASRFGRHRLPGRLIPGVACGALMIGCLQQAYSAAKVLSAGDESPRRQIAAVAEFLSRETSPRTPVLVHVWRDWAELYWRVPLAAPSFPIPHVLPGPLFNQWLTVTLAQPPDFIVWDGTPWKAIDDRQSATVTKQIPELIARKYQEIKRVGELVIYRRANR